MLQRNLYVFSWEIGIESEREKGREATKQPKKIINSVVSCAYTNNCDTKNCLLV